MLQSQISRAPSMKSLRSIKDHRAHRLPTTEDELLYNFEAGLSKVDPEAARFFSIGEDEPVRKKEEPSAAVTEAQIK